MNRKGGGAGRQPSAKGARKPAAAWTGRRARTPPRLTEVTGEAGLPADSADRE